jgi:alpha-L-arabinofuranosidase
MENVKRPIAQMISVPIVKKKTTAKNVLSDTHLKKEFVLVTKLLDLMNQRNVKIHTATIAQLRNLVEDVKEDTT